MELLKEIKEINDLLNSGLPENIISKIKSDINYLFGNTIKNYNKAINIKSAKQLAKEISKSIKALREKSFDVKSVYWDVLDFYKDDDDDDEEERELLITWTYIDRRNDESFYSDSIIKVQREALEWLNYIPYKKYIEFFGEQECRVVVDVRKATYKIIGKFEKL